MSMQSYRVRYWSKDGSTLVGAVTKGLSSRFQTPEMAELRLSSILEVNGGSDRVGHEIEEVALFPEIFVHCGSTAQAIGGKCPRCGKVLSKEDAREAT